MAESTCLYSAPPRPYFSFSHCPESYDPILIPSPHGDLSPPRVLPPFPPSTAGIKTRSFPVSLSRWKRGHCSCKSGFCCRKRARSRETRAGGTSRQPRGSLWNAPRVAAAATISRRPGNTFEGERLSQPGCLRAVHEDARLTREQPSRK